MTSSVERVPDYSFARRPKWLLSHLLVLALVATMLGAGVWQINRHQSRAERNDQIAARAAVDPIPLGDLAPPGSAATIGEDAQFTRVRISGEYRPEDEVLIRNRSYQGAPGWWVLTPFVTDDGWAVAVNRGWIPLTYSDDEPRLGTEPPRGAFEITGTIQPSRSAEGFQVADPAEGRLSSLGRTDIARLGQQVDYSLSPVVVQLDVGTDVNPNPIPLELPALSSGPHVSYAAQWFIFTTIALGGYPVVLRRVARGSGQSAPDYDDYDARR